MSYVAQYEVGRCNIGSITGSSGIRGYSEWWCGFCDGGDPAVEDGINDATDEKDGKFIEYGVDATTYEEVCKYFEENFDLESVVDCYEFGNTSSIRITENWTEKPHEGYSYMYTCCSFMDVVDLLYNQVSGLYFPGGYYGIRSLYETGFGTGYPTSYWTTRIGWFEYMYQLVANKRGVDVETLLSPIRIGEYSSSNSDLPIELPAEGTPGQTGEHIYEYNGTTTKISTYTNSANRTFIMYKQSDGPWSTMPFRNSTVGEIGCPTTAISCALTGLGSPVTPFNFIESVQTNSVESVLKMNSSDTVLVSSTPTDSAKAEIVGHLQEGKPIVYHVKASSQFTDTEHWMALLDVNEDCTQLYVATGLRSSGNTEAWYSIETALKGMDRYYLIYP